MTLIRLFLLTEYDDVTEGNLDNSGEKKKTKISFRTRLVPVHEEILALFM